MTDPTAADFDPTAAVVPSKPQSRGVAIAIIAVAVVCAAAFIWIATRDPHADAKNACEAWVKDRLVAPATAQFSKVEWDDLLVSVDGDVDSENSFGALLRTHFSCEMKHVNGKWVVMNDAP